MARVLVVIRAEQYAARWSIRWKIEIRYPREPPSQPLTGDSHAPLLIPAGELARQLGYIVTFQSTPSGVGGWCNRRTKTIMIER